MGDDHPDFNPSEDIGAPKAWLACLANAVPIAMLLIWLVEQLIGRVSAWTGLGLYVAAFALLIPATKPWSR